MKNSKKTAPPSLFNLLILLLFAQTVMLLFSVYWMVTYYNQTLIPSLDLCQFFFAQGNIGIVSSVVSLVIVVLILYTVFFKGNKKTSVLLLGILFFQSTLFFILERLYELFFMYITVMIVANTFAWANFFLLSCVSGVGLILSFLLLTYPFDRSQVKN